MKINNPAISIFVNRENVEIIIRDKTAAADIIKVEMTSEQFCAALSRNYQTECLAEVYRLDLINKKLEVKEISLDLIIPDEIKYNSNGTAKYVYPFFVDHCNKLDEGWIPDNYFQSRDSVIHKEGNLYTVTATVRRWT